MFSTIFKYKNKTVPNCIDTVVNEWLQWPEMI